MAILTEKDYLLLSSLVKKKADEDKRSNNHTDISSYTSGLIDGYTELKKVLFTEEQVLKAIELARKQFDTGLGTLSQGYMDLEYMFSKNEITKLIKNE